MKLFLNDTKKTWLKHPKDRLKTKSFTYKGFKVYITTCSRHDKQGKLQGYIVRVRDGRKVNVTRFKHYNHRSVVNTFAQVMYKIVYRHTCQVCKCFFESNNSVPDRQACPECGAIGRDGFIVTEKLTIINAALRNVYNNKKNGGE